MQLHLQNIDSVNSDVYIFLRNPKTKKLEVRLDKNFQTYYYKESNVGSYYTYDGKRANKITTKRLPRDVRFQKGVYESDVSVAKKYILEKDIEFLPSPVRYCFLDIEVLMSEDEHADKPISCISILDNYTKKVEQFFLGDYLKTCNNDMDKAEKSLLLDFVKCIKRIQPDMLLAWHMTYDWGVLTKRLPDIAQLLSPINKERYFTKEIKNAPMGISIVDYLQYFKKVYMRESSYKLDNICEKFLEKGKEHKNPDFTTINDELKLRNKEDVILMSELEDKINLIPYYDEVRKLCKVGWEELYHNSRAIEMLCLQEAKKMKLALPNKTKHDSFSFQGATRGIEETGVFENIGKYDLSGAYPAALINFCLDEMNLSTAEDVNATNINGVYFKQNPNRLLPLVAKQMVSLKEKVGAELKRLSESDKKYNRVKNQYAGIKGIVNSVFGVFGNQYFRLYNEKIVSSITFLVRDLLTYVQDELKAQGYNVIYYDTDSIFLNSSENLIDKLNGLIQEWGRLKYNKDEVTLSFNYEGHFKQLLILGTCHYYGVKTDPKAKPEVKGIEMKRASSTLFEAGFQEELIKKVLAKEEKVSIEAWIESERKRLKTLPITEFAFPTKVSLTKNYKNRPIFLRALDNTKLFDPSFKMKGGDKFFYLYIEKQGKDPQDKNIDVIAFDSDEDSIVELFKDKIDWKQMEKRNIDSKVERIFEALKWNEEEPKEQDLLDMIKEPKKKKVKVLTTNDDIF